MMLSARYREIAYALMRAVIGLLFACHGAQKVFGAFGSPGAGGDGFMILAGLIELVAGVGIAAGLLTRTFALLASGEMAVAYFKAHAPKGFWPIENGGELAVVYCFVLLAVAALGSGELSIDGVRRRRESRQSAGVSAAIARARNVLAHD
jgi:putative oxidoreductase